MADRGDRDQHDAEADAAETPERDAPGPGIGTPHIGGHNPHDQRQEKKGHRHIDEEGHAPGHGLGQDAGDQRAPERTQRPDHRLDAEDAGDQARGKQHGNEDVAESRDDPLAHTLQRPAGEEDGHRRRHAGDQRPDEEDQRRQDHRAAAADHLLQARGTGSADDRQHRIDGEGPAHQLDAADVDDGGRQRGRDQEAVEGVQRHAQAERDQRRGVAALEQIAPAAGLDIAHGQGPVRNGASF